MSHLQVVDISRVERMANAVNESVKQLKSSIDQLISKIENSSTRLNPATLREQTLANVTVILALYKDDNPEDYSAPTIVVVNSKNHSGAAVVRTYYDKTLKKARMATTIKGPICSSDFKALEGLYKLSGASVERAIQFSKNANGFDDWGDLDL